MSTSPSNFETRLMRFSVFEVDLEAGMLRKNGGRVRLQEQPFQVLAALLKNAGRVVTREELREQIWPADTFVDFDHSLNTAVNKIREALGDSASSPRFVETLARRGYRFIAAVENVALESATSATNSGVEDFEKSSLGPALHPDLQVPLPHRGFVRALFALAQVMYLVFYVCGLAHLHNADQVAASFLPNWGALSIMIAILITGAIGIPLRLYLLSAIGFDFRKLGAKFAQLFPVILTLDQLWAIAPFLLLPQIGLGLAIASTAALLYVPFAERTLLRMAYDPVNWRSPGSPR